MKPGRAVTWLAPVVAICHAVLILLLCAKGETAAERIRSVIVFDAGWYEMIARVGLGPECRVQWQSCFGFMPAFPLFVSAIVAVTPFGLYSPLPATYVAAILSYAVFWWFFFAYARTHTSPATCGAITILLFVWPGAFILNVPYAESLFMAALAAYLVGSTQAHGSRRHVFLAVTAGCVLTTSRMLGIMYLVLPALFFVAARVPWTKARVARVAAASVLPLGGIGSYFAWTAHTTGHWDEYMRATQTGWGAPPPNFLALFQAPLFHLGAETALITTPPAAQIINHVCLAIALVAALALLVGSSWRSLRLRTLEVLPIGCALLALGVLVATSAGTYVSKGNFVGHARYTYPVVLILCVGAVASTRERRQRTPVATLLSLAVAGASAFAAQVFLGRSFVMGDFVI